MDLSTDTAGVNGRSRLDKVRRMTLLLVFVMGHVACTSPGPALKNDAPSETLEDMDIISADGDAASTNVPDVTPISDRDAASPTESDTGTTLDAVTEIDTDMETSNCLEAERRLVACGLNNRGLQAERCESGMWQLSGDCEDPDTCIDEQVEDMVCPQTTDIQRRSCASGQWTSWSECPDPTPPCELTVCNEVCVDTTINPEHCGRCDNQCAADSQCCNGICVPQVFGEAPPLAIIGECGTLQYGLYPAQDELNVVNRLPDFSYAGYMGGGVPIPDVPIRVTVAPGEGDDRMRIQAAIDEVGMRTPDENGIRGAVLLTAGEFEVGDTLEINTSGTVLRGSGQGRNGTLLRATKREQHALIRLQGDASGFSELANTRAEITSAYVPVGSRTLHITDNVLFRPGDTIAVFRTPNQSWIDRLDMGQWGWTPNSYQIAHERTVVAASPGEVTVNIPFVDSIDSMYGSGFVFKSDMSRRLQHSGVEDLRLVSEYESETDENHAWNGVVFARTSNSWVRRVTVQYFGYSAVTIQNESAFNTIEEVAMLDPKSQIAGGRRYAFNLADGIGNLFQRCYARSGRHNFVSGARTTGPNVWLDCLAVNALSDEGPHHRWATGLLFDNIKSKDINVQNRTSSGTGHGWTGGQTLLWNVEALRIVCDSPSGAMNYVVGSVGEPTESRYSPNEPPCFQISPDAPVNPRSIYLQQLADRLGTTAVDNITTFEQRSGRVWTQLANWAGEGLLENASTMDNPNPSDPYCDNGIQSSDVCCSIQCGACGGTGCGARPGGASECCVGRIRTDNRRCSEGPAPCVMDTP